MLTHLLLPAPTDLALEAVLADAAGLTLVVATTASQVPCPVCAEPTARRHSRYQRTLADAPCATLPVRLKLHTRRFFCANPACPQRIFTERLPPALAAPSARRTTRLTALLRDVGQALGGEAGARLSQKLGLLTSPTTLLRLVRQTADPAPRAPRIVGIDDFAFCKGQTYGTILIDHETGQTIDLLPDRTAESVAAWLRAHPSVIIITRDRAEAYADGATQGAPQAIQVADRWHLLRNLSETLDEILTRLYPLLCQALVAAQDEALLPDGAPGPASAAMAGAPPAAPAAAAAAPQPHRRTEQLQQQRREQRLARYEEVCQRHQVGQTINQIAREMGIGQQTVRRFLRAGVFPERKPRSASANRLDPYKAYLRQRWTEGCRNRALLWREVQGQGYAGSYDGVYQYLRALEEATGSQEPVGFGHRRRPRVGRRDWRRWFGRPAAELEATEKQAVEQVCAQSAELGQVYELVQEFGRIVRAQERDKLDGWLNAALASGVEELARFARGLQKDYAAVAAALERPQSNGPTEGHVNRLKMVKRTMYGRAKFDLLRKRVLYAA